MFRYIIETLPDSSSFKKYYNKTRRAKNIRNKKKYIPEYLKDINEKFILCFDLLVMSLKTILIITSNIN